MSINTEESGPLKSNICKEDKKPIGSKNNHKKRINQSLPKSTSYTDHFNKSPLMMNDDAESAFTIGSIVVIETGWGHNFEGEVIAFDYRYRILLLKCLALSGNTARNDIHLINLQCVKTVKVKKEAKKKEPYALPKLEVEVEKVEQRKNEAIDERKRLVEAFDAGINEEGLKLFLHLSKTVNTIFEGKDIIVMKDVVITHPYKSENCKINQNQGSNSDDRKNNKNDDAVSYVKKLVEKFWNDN